jgi:peptide/nickel transport system substrate-binding protein
VTRGGPLGRRRAWRALAGAGTAAVLVGAGVAGGGGMAPAPGGTVRVVDYPLSAATAPLVSLDPQGIGAGDVQELLRCCLVRTLLGYAGVPAAQGGFELRPDLADAMPTVSRNGLTWTFHLRRGIHYAPPLAGVEITAGDIRRSLQRLASRTLGAFGPIPALSAIQGFDAYAHRRAGTISGLETPDRHTLVLRLLHPQADLGANVGILAPIPPSPRHARAPLGVATGHPDDGRYLVSSGPYMIEGSDRLRPDLPVAEQRPVSGYVPGRSVTLVRNPVWDRATDPLRPALADRIEVRLVPSRAEAARQIDEGRADLAIQPAPPVAPPSQVRRYRAHPQLGSVETRPVLHVRWLAMNIAAPPFDDIHVRRALAWAVDKRAYLRALGAAVTARPFGHVAPDLLEGNRLRGWDAFPTRGGRGSVARARAEMRLSRYDRDHDGRCDAPACSRIRAVVIPRPPLLRGARSEERDMARIGLHVSHLFHSPKRAPELRFHQSGPMHMALEMGVGQVGLIGDPLDFLTYFSAGDERSIGFSLVGARPAQLRAWDTVRGASRPSTSGSRAAGPRRATPWPAARRASISTSCSGWCPSFRW